jgi:hypothetical protein
VGYVVKPDKSRYVYLYLPSTEDKTRWGDLAKEAGLPLSKFIIGIVEDALAEESDFRPRGKLVKEIAAQRDEIKTLREEIKLKSIVLDKYENELKRYRSAAFVEEKFEGARKYTHDIVDILKRGKVIDSYRLLEELHIDPRDSDLVKGVSTQLENLEAYGLVTSTQRGWRWVG